MNWIKDIYSPETRKWEDFYRNRWQHDKVVRSTHGVNCTGGCSWMVYVKDGIVTWEMQALDYEQLAGELPPYEPRGCQRGISFSWYIYSPLRVKYPYLRGTLMDLWRAAKKEHGDPVHAWAAIVEDPVKRKAYQTARGKGGFRRASWDECLEIITAANIYTIKQHGPDKIIGFSPIPAMSMLSYGAGSRFLQLIGGVNLSFYDWYCDLPNASPEIWGEQTDVAESADWYHSKYIATVGSNVSMTRTPDAHFLTEARHNGTKVVTFAPDFNMTSKNSDWWLPINAGQDCAFWMAVNQIILKEFHHESKTPYFLDYVKQYSDSPFLVKITKGDDGSYRAGRLLQASSIAKYKAVENADFKYIVFDQKSGEVKMPKGSLGFRWQQEKGHWNLEPKDGLDNSEIDFQLSLLEDKESSTMMISLADFAEGEQYQREIPVRTLQSDEGEIQVATIYDLLMAQFGVARGKLKGYPADYDDETSPYTPAWQERITGISRDTLIQFAREWASTAARTEGKCSIIIGAGANHWYHSNLIYRAAITSLIMCGCVGRNGGGLNHYVGQEKLAPMSSWATIAMASDWTKPPRLQNAPSFHYVHSDQWRYEKASCDIADISNLTDHKNLFEGHSMDFQAKAVRCGWLPFFPQFNQNTLSLAKDAHNSGASTNAEVADFVVKKLVATQKKKQTGEKLNDDDLNFAVEDPDAPEAWPRMLYMWRGNALMSSAKGHEYFMKHYLGTHHNSIADECAEDSVKDVHYRKESPEGKLDLVVDINFRMDTSALYSDIVLPTATWYEKNDLNTTDMHSFVHPLSQAVPPCWESKTDWNIFKEFAEKLSKLAEDHLSEPVKDIVSNPIQHDTPGEMSQPTIKDWAKGECEAIPGKTMPNFVTVERDYTKIYQKYISYGRNVRENGLAMHGISWRVDDFYDELIRMNPTEEWGGQVYPSLSDAKDAANVILALAPETNGESAYRAFQAEEKKVGLPLTHLAEKNRGSRTNFDNITSQPRRILTSPIWSGDVNDGRSYSSYVINVENQVPWRTLTGRQHLYLDHEAYIAVGENLPTYKPKPDPMSLAELKHSDKKKDTLMLNYLTPHGKWHIHSTYFDNLRMLTLGRGLESAWINDKDADEIGLEDHDWVEMYNDNGVVVTRVAVSARIPRSLCYYYHATERTINIPKSPERKNRRAGGHNSLTRVRLKPSLMIGGYGQFSYGFNYWGPTGITRDSFVYIRKLEGEPQW